MNRRFCSRLGPANVCFVTDRQSAAHDGALVFACKLELAVERPNRLGHAGQPAAEFHTGGLGHIIRDLDQQIVALEFRFPSRLPRASSVCSGLREASRAPFTALATARACPDSWALRIIKVIGNSRLCRKKNIPDLLQFVLLR